MENGYILPTTVHPCVCIHSIQTYMDIDMMEKALWALSSDHIFDAFA